MIGMITMAHAKFVPAPMPPYVYGDGDGDGDGVAHNNGDTCVHVCAHQKRAEGENCCATTYIHTHTDNEKY
jgi:hypothetical protein